MASKHLCNFIAILNLGIVTKKKMINVVLKANYIKKFIDVIFKQGLIYGYNLQKESKKNSVICFEKVTIYFKPGAIRKIILMSSPSHKKSLSAYKLRSLHYKNRGTVFIMSTSKFGFTNSVDCEKNNIGGLMICGFVIGGPTT